MMPSVGAVEDRSERKLLPKPRWVVQLEERIAAAVPLHPNALSLGKLLVTAPLLWALGQRAPAAVVVALFLGFATLDYLDGVVARGRKLATPFGRVLDRLTDYPLIVALTLACAPLLPLPLVAAKLVIDASLMLLYALGRGSTENRMRTALSTTALFGLLALSQGWLPAIVSETAVTYLLLGNIVFSAVVALYNLDVLQKRFIADALSLGNLCCGLLAVLAARRGHFETSLALVLLGAGFDGLDGLAARRWGSTRWGVYSDDVADAVNFAIAPAAAVYYAVGGVEGTAIALLLACFTIGRLVFFTINKEGSDPRYFAGVPSPIGAIIALSAVVLFRDRPALVGLLVGLACAHMVAFSARYRHIGRALAEHRRLLLRTPLALVPLIGAALVWGIHGAVALLLAAALGYALLPVARAFKASWPRTSGAADRARHAPPSAAPGCDCR